MKKNNLQKIIITTIALLLVVGYFTIPINTDTATAQPQSEKQTNTITQIFLNEESTSRTRPDPREWDNVLRGVICPSCKENNCICEESLSLWLLQYSGPIGQVQSIHLTFIDTTNNARIPFVWYPPNGPSIRNGTDEVGWLITAPARYIIDFKDVKGNYVELRIGIQDGDDPDNKNVSGVVSATYYTGTPCFCVPEYTWGGLVAIVACFAALGMFYMVKNRGNIRQLKT
ncbi:MAG: hypothetical protein LBH62_06335 [Nitrososphaerota archaeon]|jgi:hypothetical protein|nr:hypothetical protein [Nitrososphaerota archaeon]